MLIYANVLERVWGGEIVLYSSFLPENQKEAKRLPFHEEEADFSLLLK